MKKNGPYGLFLTRKPQVDGEKFNILTIEKETRVFGSVCGLNVYPQQAINTAVEKYMDSNRGNYIFGLANITIESKVKSLKTCHRVEGNPVVYKK